MRTANSILFTPGQRNAVILSNIGIVAVLSCIKLACDRWGIAAIIKYYGIPWLEVTHWCKSIAMALTIS